MRNTGTVFIVTFGFEEALISSLYDTDLGT